MASEKINICWFRRDLRLEDNRALQEALHGGWPVLPVFIFDTEIIDELKEDDPRITFIHDTLVGLNTSLKKYGSGMYCLKGHPLEVWKNILHQYDVEGVYANEDYEPYAIQRDKNIEQLLSGKGIAFKLYKDQVIFAKDEILKSDGTPYSVFTPYKNQWLQKFGNQKSISLPTLNQSNYVKLKLPFPSLAEIGFKQSAIKVIPYDLTPIDVYPEVRNYPYLDQTTHLSTHLRFGTVSIHNIVKQAAPHPVFLSELIWREFFMQILFHYPEVVHANFKRKYDAIPWRNNNKEFEAWKNGTTGYPLVDAGMRELLKTGYMHNRVRMITAGFLCKHLLIDWRWGEAYFAEKLLDYDLASNNGNWQWAAGTGCDAAPYFRIFNPQQQLHTYDKDTLYVKKWIPELNTPDYPSPIVDHQTARERAIATYQKAIRS